MNKNKSLALIEKLIRRTKENSLHWEKYLNSNIELKPLVSSPIDDSLLAPVFDSATFSLDQNNSYLCLYNGGVFALLLYKSPLFGTDVQLRIQSPNSLNSQTYTSTYSTNDVNESSQLKRLYNLVTSSITSPGIDNFIDNFLQD